MPVVGLLVVDLHFPNAQSLKDKRRVLRGVKDRLQKLNVAVAETDHANLWQRAQLGVVAVGNSSDRVDQTLRAVVDEVDRVEPGLITRAEIDFLSVAG